MRQILASERLDEDLGSAAEIRAALDDLGWVYRRLGGRSSMRQLLGPLLAGWRGRRLAILDVGAGTGEAAADLRAWLAAQGVTARMVALDRQRSHLRAASGIATVAADVFHPPFRRASFDVVTCSLFLHHFHGAAAARMLETLAWLAREAVIINDLERGWAPYLVFAAIAPWKLGRLSREDGYISLRQAYTAAELRDLAHAARYADCQVRRLWPFRLGLITRPAASIPAAGIEGIGPGD